MSGPVGHEPIVARIEEPPRDSFSIYSPLALRLMQKRHNEQRQLQEAQRKISDAQRELYISKRCQELNTLNK